MPRSLIVIVIWCRASGSEVQKSQLLSATAQVGAGVTFDGMVQIGEFQRISQEEHGGIVSHQIPVSFVRVELDGKTADIAFGVRRATLTRYRGKAYEQLGLLSHRGENLGFGVFGDVVRGRKGAVSTGTLGVHPAFGDHLAVKMSEFLQEPYIL